MDFTNTQLDVEELPHIEQVEFKQHPARYFTLRMISFSITFTFLAASWIVPLLFEASTIALILGIIWLLIGCISLTEEIKGFAIRGYVLRENDISYRKGFLFFSQITIPFNRIQHCEIAQGPIARSFNLSALSIYTAGGSASDLRIGGLEPDEAKRLRDYIAKVSSTYE